MGFREGQKDWVALTPEEEQFARTTCRPIPGWSDQWFTYWIGQDGKNLFFIMNKPINAMGKTIVNHRHPIHMRGKYLSTKLIHYESLGWLYDYDDCYVCSPTYKAMHIHVLVAMAWIGDKPEGCTLVRHLDGSELNNHYQNLAWGTNQDNSDDKAWHDKVGKGAPESVRPECRNLPYRICANAQLANA